MSAGSFTLRDLVRAGQHRVASALGVDERRLVFTVIAMHENIARRAPGYWIQLFLSMGIATLGLVLGSTAVVIGAMLVSPLMGPLLELGMGFAVGSSLLVIRAFIRVSLSVVFVIIGAALFTLLLPFHQVTPEIASRTAPTALDLLVAIFCALTAAYTIVRPSADSTAAAAGTAIGIALVPPLCTIGFGLGTGSLAIAGGAALLFTANLSAILVFAVLSFLTVGFDQVDAVAVEEGFHTDGDGGRADVWAAKANHALGRMFGSRYGLAMRVLIPGLFFAGVAVPLSRALDEVTWEVRSRDAIRRILAADAPQAVQTSVGVDRHTIRLRLMVIGSAEMAANLETSLRARIEEASGIAPDVSVLSVASASELAAAAVAQQRPEPAPVITVPFRDVAARTAVAVRAAWPSAAGVLVQWDVTIPPTSTPIVTVRHLGPELDEAGRELLAAAITSRMNSEVLVRGVALPVMPITAARGRTAEWATRAKGVLSDAAGADSVTVCVQAPASARRARTADSAILASLMDSDVGRSGRLTLVGAGPWAIRVTTSPCIAAGTSPSSASAVP